MNVSSNSLTSASRTGAYIPQLSTANNNSNVVTPTQRHSSGARETHSLPFSSFSSNIGATPLRARTLSPSAPSLDAVSVASEDSFASSCSGQSDGNLLPSEVARLVLGYLLASGTKKAHQAFLLESKDLEEYRRVSGVGAEETSENRKPKRARRKKTPVIATTIGGLSLIDMLEDYCALKLQRLDPPESLGKRHKDTWTQFEKLMKMQRFIAGQLKQFAMLDVNKKPLGAKSARVQGARTRNANEELRKRRAKEKLMSERAKGAPSPTTSGGLVVTGQACAVAALGTGNGMISPDGGIQVLTVSKSPSKGHIVAHQHHQNSALQHQFVAHAHSHNHHLSGAGVVQVDSTDLNRVGVGNWHVPSQDGSLPSTSGRSSSQQQQQQQQHTSTADVSKNSDSDTSITNCTTVADVVSKTIGTPCKVDEPSMAPSLPQPLAPSLPPKTMTVDETRKSPPKRKSHTPRKGIPQPRRLSEKPPQKVHHHQSRKSNSNPTRTVTASPDDDAFNAREFEDWLTKVESSDFPNKIARIVNQTLQCKDPAPPQPRSSARDVGNTAASLIDQTAQVQTELPQPETPKETSSSKIMPSSVEVNEPGIADATVTATVNSGNDPSSIANIVEGIDSALPVSPDMLEDLISWMETSEECGSLFGMISNNIIEAAGIPGPSNVDSTPGVDAASTDANDTSGSAPSTISGEDNGTNTSQLFETHSSQLQASNLPSHQAISFCGTPSKRTATGECYSSITFDFGPLLSNASNGDNGSAAVESSVDSKTTDNTPQMGTTSPSMANKSVEKTSTTENVNGGLGPDDMHAKLKGINLLKASSFLLKGDSGKILKGKKRKSALASAAAAKNLKTALINAVEATTTTSTSLTTTAMTVVPTTNSTTVVSALGASAMKASPQASSMTMASPEVSSMTMASTQSTSKTMASALVTSSMATTTTTTDKEETEAKSRSKEKVDPCLVTSSGHSPHFSRINEKDEVEISYASKVHSSTMQQEQQQELRQEQQKLSLPKHIKEMNETVMLAKIKGIDITQASSFLLRKSKSDKKKNKSSSKGSCKNDKAKAKQIVLQDGAGKEQSVDRNRSDGNTSGTLNTLQNEVGTDDAACHDGKDKIDGRMESSSNSKPDSTDEAKSCHDNHCPNTESTGDNVKARDSSPFPTEESSGRSVHNIEKAALTAGQDPHLPVNIESKSIDCDAAIDKGVALALAGQDPHLPINIKSNSIVDSAIAKDFNSSAEIVRPSIATNFHLVEGSGLEKDSSFEIVRPSSSIGVDDVREVSSLENRFAKFKNLDLSAVSSQLRGKAKKTKAKLGEIVVEKKKKRSKEKREKVEISCESMFVQNLLTGIPEQQQLQQEQLQQQLQQQKGTQPESPQQQLHSIFEASNSDSPAPKPVENEVDRSISERFAKLSRKTDDVDLAKKYSSMMKTKKKRKTAVGTNPSSGNNAVAPTSDVAEVITSTSAAAPATTAAAATATPSSIPAATPENKGRDPSSLSLTTPTHAHSTPSLSSAHAAHHLRQPAGFLAFSPIVALYESPAASPSSQPHLNASHPSPSPVKISEVAPSDQIDANKTERTVEDVEVAGSGIGEGQGMSRRAKLFKSPMKRQQQHLQVYDQPQQHPRQTDLNRSDISSDATRNPSPPKSKSDSIGHSVLSNAEEQRIDASKGSTSCPPSSSALIPGPIISGSGKKKLDDIFYSGSSDGHVLPKTNDVTHLLTSVTQSVTRSQADPRQVAENESVVDIDQVHRPALATNTNKDGDKKASGSITTRVERSTRGNRNKNADNGRVRQEEVTKDHLSRLTSSTDKGDLVELDESKINETIKGSELGINGVVKGSNDDLKSSGNTSDSRGGDLVTLGLTCGSSAEMTESKDNTGAICAYDEGDPRRNVSTVKSGPAADNVDAKPSMTTTTKKSKKRKRESHSLSNLNEPSSSSANVSADVLNEKALYNRLMKIKDLSRLRDTVDYALDTENAIRKEGNQTTTSK